jgi:glycosyltransferase involved in cell wall biosynthesis
LSDIKKIAIIGPAHPLRGGIANFNEALAKAFLNDGKEVKLFSFKLQYPAFLFPGTTQFDNGAAPHALKIETVLNSINPINWIISAFRIKAFKPDLIVVRFWLPFMGPCLGSVVRIIKFFYKVPVIAITDNVIPHEKRFGDRIFTQYFVKSCDAFVAMSKSVLTDLANFTDNDKKIFLPHPLYTIFGEPISKSQAQSKLNLNPDDVNILFFGFIRKYKGLSLLLKSFAKTTQKHTNAKLIVAGEFYEDSEPYLKLIKTLNIQDKVVLKTNYIPADEVKYYFSACDLVAQTYLTATQSGVTQIAYFYHTPMLVTNVGGLAEIVPNHKVGYVCEQNENEISDCLNDFIENNRYNQFRDNIKSEKHRFEWSYFTGGIYNLVSDIVKN